MRDGDGDLDTRLKAMIYGYRRTQVVYLMVKLDIPGLLGGGPARADEIAAKCGADPGMLLDLLRVLAAEGLLEETGAEMFRLTSLGAGLGRPGIASSALLAGEESYCAWGASLTAMRTGASGFEAAFGTPFWTYFAARPGTALDFGNLMMSSAAGFTAALAAVERFAAFSTVVDVGGGSGHLLAAILREHPRLNGVLFDMPSVTDKAADILRAAGVLGRCLVRSGSFFDAVPEGRDLYLLCRVLCDWTDRDASRILARCRQASREDSVLLIVARLAGYERTAGPMPGLHMRIVTGGRERTAAEYQSLLATAGFTIRETNPISDTDLSTIWANAA
jgi:hypothetical protein